MLFLDFITWLNSTYSHWILPISICLIRSFDKVTQCRTWGFIVMLNHASKTDGDKLFKNLLTNEIFSKQILTWNAALFEKGTGMGIAWLKIKACVCCFFIKFMFFCQKIVLKNYKNCFLFHRKSSFHSWYIQIFVISSLSFHTFQIQKDKWKWNNLWCY